MPGRASRPLRHLTCGSRKRQPFARGGAWYAAGMTLRPLLSPARRLCRRIAWTTTTSVVAVVWVSTAWWSASTVSNQLAVDVGSGAIAVIWASSGFGRSLPPGTRFKWVSDYQSSQSSKLDLWLARSMPRVHPFPPGGWAGIVPLWLILLPLLVPTTRAWLAKTIGPGACSRCGYDLTGLSPAAACPECGTTPPAAPHSGHTAPAASPARS